MKRRMMAMLLALLLVAVVGTVSAAEVGGNCGASGSTVTWAYDEASATLTISGNGEMRSFLAASYAPWYAYRANIKTVVIAQGVTAVGNNAFNYYTALETVELASTVRSIGEGAFMLCSRLEQIEIPAATVNIGASAFLGCSSLEGISVAAENPAYSSDESGVLYNKDQTMLIQAPVVLAGSYTVPGGVLEIGEQAFYDCGSLTEIVLPESLKVIGKAAFQRCEKLKGIAIPGAVTEIGEGAFLGCSSLWEIHVAAENACYSSDAYGVLFNKAKTELIQAPGGLSDSYELPASVTEIAENAFWYCENLIEVKLPTGLRSIGKAAFSSCFMLESIHIPVGVTVIPAEAFSGCFSLREIRLPGTVKTIERNAFASCEMLETIVFAGNAPEIAADAFADVYATAYTPANDPTWTADKKVGYGGELEWDTLTLFDLAGANMALGNSLTMYLYVNMSDVAEGDYYMEIVKTYADGRDDVVKKVPMSEWSPYTTMYYVSFDGVAAKEMTDDFYVTVYRADGTQASNTRVISVADYAISMLNSTAASHNLMADMLNYGAAAQQSFKYAQNDLANANMTDAHKAFATQNFSMDQFSNNTVKGTGFMGANLSLESSICMYMYFDHAVVDRTMTARVSYTSHSKKAVSYEISGSDFVVLGGYGFYGVEITTMAAADAESVVTVEILDGSTVVASGSTSVESVAVNGYTGVPLYVDLMKFCTAAYNFFH